MADYDIRDEPIEHTCGGVEALMSECPGCASPDTDDIRDEPIRFMDIVQMGQPPTYGWECAVCNSSSGLDFGQRWEAVSALDVHIEQEHPNDKGTWEERPR